MRKGYLKSSHIDRRDHLIHGILYPCSDHHNGGDILINELKKKKIILMFSLRKKI